MTAVEIKDALSRGEFVIGTQVLEVRQPSIAEVFARIGYDFLIVDCEHGPYDLETVSDIIRVARCCGIAPFVRIAEPQYHLVARYLDAGAQGIILPRVESRDQIIALRNAMYYRPVGRRGVAMGIASTDYVALSPDEHRSVSNQVLLIVQIESAAAVDNLQAILGDDGAGVDVLCVGSVDLSFTTTTPGDVESEETCRLVQKVLVWAEEHGIPAGYPDPDLGRTTSWMEKGFRFIWYGADLAFLNRQARADLEELRNVAHRVKRS